MSSFNVVHLPLTSLTLLVLTCAPAHANIPAAYLACEGAELGESCVMTGPQYGVCVRDTLCEDPEETAVNECVLCVDACWAQEEGTECVRPWTGEEGVCEAQTQCTDREETSFTECVRCVEPPEPPPAEVEGCNAPVLRTPPTTLTLWALLCVWLGVRCLKVRKEQS